MILACNLTSRRGLHCLRLMSLRKEKTKPSMTARGREQPCAMNNPALDDDKGQSLIPWPCHVRTASLAVRSIASLCCRPRHLIDASVPHRPCRRQPPKPSNHLAHSLLNGRKSPWKQSLVRVSLTVSADACRCLPGYPCRGPAYRGCGLALPPLQALPPLRIQAVYGKRAREPDSLAWVRACVASKFTTIARAEAFPRPTTVSCL